MADILGSSATTATIGIGETVVNDLEVTGDHDWFKITLVAGQSISVALDGITLEDPYLRIRDASGTVIYQNDDTNPGIDRDSLLAFTANYTGTYYIDVGAWDENYTGTYSLSVTPYVPPPVATADQVADQLVEGYWGGNDRHFNVTQGGTLTVNLTGLTAAGANLAREALALWTDVIGVTFQEVTAGGQIVFDDNDTGAYSTSVVSNHIISSSKINVSTQWLTNYGSGLTSYSFQTYIHEIGHALGLGHAGNYNETARYPYDANFLNDSWAMTIMSYFDQAESTYFGDQGFTEERIVTPMVADILAMARLYGLSSVTRAGDTTYGFNSTANRAVFDANQYSNVAFTIYDSGGTDTIDVSGFSSAQSINLNPESFSNYGTGNVGNLSIARGVVIENAIGGSAGDTLTGNGADNYLRGNGGNDFLYGNAGNDTLEGGSGIDTLTGGAGTDTFRDSGAGLNGDTITDFLAGDVIIFTDAAFSSFTFNLSGNILNYSGGSLTLNQVPSGQLVASAAVGGGVQLSVATAMPLAPNSVGQTGDFNGDGKSDVLWRNNNGDVTNWLGQANGGFVGNLANSFNAISTAWQVNGIGDFNGDGRDDVLWRNADGAVTNWLGQISGGFVGNYNNSLIAIDNGWKVAGVGDFNGDGRDDVLWRNANGVVTNWLGQSNGSFIGNIGNSNNFIDNSWQIAGVGDFNGDGWSDILWRNASGAVTNWLGQANGNFVGNMNNANYMVDSGWQVAGVGDFNGDGRDDILWRNAAGAVTDWLGQVNGSFAGNLANSYNPMDKGWHVAGIGDFNGDGRDDVLWRNTNGVIANWLGQANGGFAGNLGNSFNAIDNGWHVQAPDSLW